MLLLATGGFSGINGVGVTSSFPWWRCSSLTAVRAAVRTGSGGELAGKAGSVVLGEESAGDGVGRAWRRGGGAGEEEREGEGR